MKALAVLAFFAFLGCSFQRYLLTDQQPIRGCTAFLDGEHKFKRYLDKNEGCQEETLEGPKVDVPAHLLEDIIAMALRVETIVQNHHTFFIGGAPALLLQILQNHVAVVQPFKNMRELRFTGTPDASPLPTQHLQLTRDLVEPENKDFFFEYLDDLGFAQFWVEEIVYLVDVAEESFRHSSLVRMLSWYYQEKKMHPPDFRFIILKDIDSTVLEQQSAVTNEIDFSDFKQFVKQADFVTWPKEYPSKLVYKPLENTVGYRPFEAEAILVASAFNTVNFLNASPWMLPTSQFDARHWRRECKHLREKVGSGWEDLAKKIANVWQLSNEAMKRIEKVKESAIKGDFMYDLGIRVKEKMDLNPNQVSNGTEQLKFDEYFREAYYSFLDAFKRFHCKEIQETKYWVNAQLNVKQLKNKMRACLKESNVQSLHSPSSPGNTDRLMEKLELRFSSSLAKGNISVIPYIQDEKNDNGKGEENDNEKGDENKNK